MENKFLKFIFIFFILTAQIVSAANSCFEHMQEKKAKFDHIMIYQNQQYKVVKVVEGNHGGQVVIIKRWRTTDDWKIKATQEHGLAPRGNPLWIFQALPKSIVDHFGFKMYDVNRKRILETKNANPEYIAIPDVYEINGALKKLNELLVKNDLDGLPFQFYLNNGVVSDNTFLKNYLYHLALPFASHNEVLYHDLNYHLIPFLIFNNKIVELSKIHSEVFIKFVDWLKLNYPKATDHGLVKKIEFVRTNHIDGTANISIMMAEPEITAHHQRAITGMKGIVGWGRSPFNYLTFTFEKKWKEPDQKVFRQVKPEMLEQFGKTLPPEFFVVDKESEQFYQDINAVKRTIGDRLKQLEFVLLNQPKAEPAQSENPHQITP